MGKQMKIWKWLKKEKSIFSAVFITEGGRKYGEEKVL